MDWRVYGLLGLPTVEAPSVDAAGVPVEPNNRPFEVRLAREVATDISASEWFRVHKREAPKDVGGPLADLYRQRLRLLDDPEHGKQLRLLEAPETKRRWSPPDDQKAFLDAVRTWLLERLETTFREQSQPELRSARLLALELGHDLAVVAAHELLTEESGLDLVRLISDLVDSEGVPFLAGFRYAETGMEKRATWEETWRLQRIEDENPKKLGAELKGLNVKSIPLPDKYVPKDYLRHFWSLRGKLDVPKERFVTIPAGNTDEDTTPLVGCAGWNHLQIAQALSGLYQRRKTEDGWTKDRLVPLLAGIDERVPWLLQWHNDVDPEYGWKLGEFFRDFVAGEAHALGIAVGDLRKWTPPAAPKRTTIDPAEALAALAAWKPEIEEDDEDDGEETETPEGPTDVQLASAVGVTKALITKALKKLIADGHGVEDPRLLCHVDCQKPSRRADPRSLRRPGPLRRRARSAPPDGRRQVLRGAERRCETGGERLGQARRDAQVGRRYVRRGRVRAVCRRRRSGRPEPARQAVQRFGADLLQVLDRAAGSVR
jgi:hypothetical protein